MTIEPPLSGRPGLTLQDLPVDLLSPILSHLRHRVKDLAACALVCKLFHETSTALLYERLFLRDQRRLRLVFQTLGCNAELCRLVKIIELRVFPFGLNAESLEKLEAEVEATFREAINLEELVWTRTGSLNDRLIPSLLGSSPNLRRLEITGDARTWSTKVLVQHISPGIQHLSIILPERSVVNALIDIAAKISLQAPAGIQASNRTGDVVWLGEDHETSTGLRSLSLLSQHSPILTDAHLMALAPHLSRLQRLSLAGNRAVTGRGIATVLSAASKKGPGVTDLALEGLNIQAKDIEMLLPFAPNLRLLSLTYPRSASSSGSRVLPSSAVNEFYRNLATLIEQAEDLTELTHYAGAGSRPAMDGDGGMDDALVDLDELDEDDEDDYDEDGEYNGASMASRSSEITMLSSDALIRRFSGPPPAGSVRYGQSEPSQPPPNLPLLPSFFLSRIVARRGPQLTKLRLHGIGISLDQLQIIVQHCFNLRDLVIQIWEDDLSRLAALICQLPQLETLHILASTSSDTVLGEMEIQWIAQVCADVNRERRIRRQRYLSGVKGTTIRDASTVLPRELIEGNGLHQIGFRNRVWLVERSFLQNSSTTGDVDHIKAEASETEIVSQTRKADGRTAPGHGIAIEDEEPIQISLRRWDPAAGTFPEVLLVVKS